MSGDVGGRGAGRRAQPEGGRVPFRDSRSRVAGPRAALAGARAALVSGRATLAGARETLAGARAALAGAWAGGGGPLRVVLVVGAALAAALVGAFLFGAWHVVFGGLVKGNPRAGAFGLVLAAVAAGLLAAEAAIARRILPRSAGSRRVARRVRRS